MNVVVMMFLGAGFGLGVVLLLAALRPTSDPILEIFDSVAAPGVGYHDDPAEPASIRSALGSLGSALALGTNDEKQLRKDLAVSEQTLEQHGLVKAAGPALALVSVYVMWLLLSVLGVVVNPAAVTGFGLCVALVAFVVPDVRLRARAKQRRIAFRHALSAYLDLVTIIMSGGGGLITALQASADAGDGWAFAEIRAALDRARLSNRTPWSQLGILGERFDIPELRDLVATAELAGSEGARVVESVSTKSDVLRARLQAEVEQASESLTEQMLLPVGLLLVALFLFLGFAVFQQLGGSTPAGFEEEFIAMNDLRTWRGA